LTRLVFEIRRSEGALVAVDAHARGDCFFFGRGRRLGHGLGGFRVEQQPRVDALFTEHEAARAAVVAAEQHRERL
jgi:hypothetical protein